MAIFLDLPFVAKEATLGLFEYDDRRSSESGSGSGFAIQREAIGKYIQCTILNADARIDEAYKIKHWQGTIASCYSNSRLEYFDASKAYETAD
jgi:hypothetical protein